MTFETVTTVHGPDCEGCAREAENAVTMATVTGSIGGTSQDGRTHGATVRRMPNKEEGTGMETMNGYTVIAEKPDGEDRIILAVRADDHSPTHFEYVTAACDAKAKNPTSWYWGHYIRDLAEAVEDFQKR